MPNENLLDLRRNLDAVLTKNVLGSFDSLPLAARCAQQLAAIPNSTYYLKGGNAIALLDNIAPTGDWDFQFKPTEEIYNDWNNRFNQIDAPIIQVLNNVAIEFLNRRTPEITNEFINLKNGTLRRFEGPNPALTDGNLKKYLQNLADAEPANVTSNFTVGRNDFIAMRYAQILRDPRFKEGRLELGNNNNYIIDLVPGRIPGNGGCIPSIYVNYTIPGFILYRLVIRYEYRLNRPIEGKDKVVLKSELIDISVPRIGSPEKWMAQEGVVTHFFNQPIRENNIRIPGWGYHLYENINLLQEIKLGISGSPHKKAKRIERGQLAFDRIGVLNPQRDLVGDIAELRDSQNGHTHSFRRVYLNTFDCNIVTTAIPNGNARDLIKNILYNQFENRLETVRLGNSRPITFNDLVTFDFEMLNRPSVGQIIDYLKYLLEELPPSKVVINREILNHESNRKNFRVISPLLDLNNDKNFLEYPLPFVLIKVTQTFLNVLRERIVKSIKYFKNIDNLPENITVLQLTVDALNVRFIFVREIVEINYRIEPYLENTILLSQRYALAYAYEKQL